MTVNTARVELHRRLVGLEEAACAARRKQGSSCSRREAAKAAARSPINVIFDAKRISSWVPEAASDAQVPADPEPEAFLALVQVWSDWAGWKYRKDEWVTLLGNARRERANALPPVALRTTVPAAPAGFCGRVDDLDTVLDALAPAVEAPTAVCIAGPPGVGKTALVLVAAYRAQQKGLFTTALFVDLLGYHDAPADPADLLAILLRGLDVDVSTAGSNVAERGAAYRSRLAELARTGHPVLIVADNVADAAAVRPLLPPSGPHRLLVTSRHTLHTLDARLIDLPVMSDDTSTELLVTVLRNADPADARARTAPEALTALARQCGGLPLALRITAALLIREPHLAAAELAEELVEVGPLEGLDDGEQSVRAALELSYRRLSPELARVFCLLALVPGPDLSAESAEVLTGLRRPMLRRRIAELARAHLVDGTRTAGRWQMHDLVRAFAMEQGRVRRQTPETGRYGHAELQRLLRHYDRRVGAAEVWVRGFAAETETPVSFPDRRQAFQWLDAEHRNLVGAVVVAAGIGNPEEAVSLALGLTEYLRFRLLRAEAALVLRVAERVAQTPFDRAQVLDNLGNVLADARQLDQAIALHEQALELFRDQDRQGEQGFTLVNLGVALRLAGRPKEAVARLRQARAIFQRIGKPFHRAVVWNNLAMAWFDDQAFSQATRAANQAVIEYQAAGNTRGEVIALFNLFKALFGVGRHTDAWETARRAIALSADAAIASHELGQVIVGLAAALRAAGQLEEEQEEEIRAMLETAADLFDEAGLPGIGDVARRFAKQNKT